MLYEVFVDGAARGQGSQDGSNRLTYGHGAVAAMVYGNKKLVAQYARGLGKVTHSAAEYEAVLLGLLLCWPSDVIRNPTIYSDSKVTVNQINGLWRCNNSELLPLLKSIQKIQEIYQFRLEYLPRSQVAGADAMANAFLNEILEPPEELKKKRK